MIAALSTYSKRRVAYESTTLDRVVVVTYRISANRSNAVSSMIDRVTRDEDPTPLVILANSLNSMIRRRIEIDE